MVGNTYTDVGGKYVAIPQVWSNSFGKKMVLFTCAKTQRLNCAGVFYWIAIGDSEVDNNSFYLWNVRAPFLSPCSPLDSNLYRLRAQTLGVSPHGQTLSSLWLRPSSPWACVAWRSSSISATTQSYSLVRRQTIDAILWWLFSACWCYYLLLAETKYVNQCRGRRRARLHSYPVSCLFICFVLNWLCLLQPKQAFQVDWFVWVLQQLIFVIADSKKDKYQRASWLLHSLFLSSHWADHFI